MLDEHGQRRRYGVRIEPFPIHAAWRKRLGAYDLTNEELGALSFQSSPHVELEMDGEYLVLTAHPNVQPAIGLSWAVRTLSDDEAVFESFVDYLGGETLLVVRTDGRERILLSGYELEKIVD